MANPLPRRATILGLVAVGLALLRFFLRAWLEPLGVPAALGSLLASLWLLLAVALFLFFGQQGRAEDGSYWRSAGWFFLLAAWCEVLVIGGILLSGATGMETYYQGPFQAVRDTFPSASQHALGHVQGFWPRTLFGLLLGAIIYFGVRRFSTSD